MTNSDFNSKQDELQQAQQAAEKSRLSCFLIKEKLKRIADEKSRLDRIFDVGNEAHVIRRHQLERLREKTEAEAKNLDAAYARDKAAALEKLHEFAHFTDPREGVGYLSDSLPFLLFPVRIETRFKQVVEDDQARHQLWVRIYPDDAVIDSFEPVLSEGEVENAKSYWIELWRSGGSEDQDRAAWSSLVGSLGSGRAYWILTHYEPLNKDAIPEKTNPEDIILIIATEEALNPLEQTATDDYWKAVWLADGNPDAEAAALAALEVVVGVDRAEVILATYQPVNLEDAPEAPLTKADVNLTVATLLFPKTSALELKQDSWAQAARVNVMPDRFVLNGYVNGNKVLERIGRPIPSPLIVSPDPSAPAEEQPRKEDGEIILGEDISWTVDFDQAVAIGMAFKIDLSEEAYQNGFDRLEVLGIRLSSDKADSQMLLQTLIDHHHYSTTGFRILPQGTPTNNTEETGAGYTSDENPDVSYEDYFLKDDLFEETSDWAEKKDGQWLAEFLGIETKALKKVQSSGSTDQCEARAMNVALWPATLGYFMDTMMEPVFDNDEVIRQTHWYFTNFVSGRGMVPAVQIGEQPYGILPATVYSRMSWFNADDTYIRGMMYPVGYLNFFQKLYEILTRIDSHWNELLERVSYVGKSGDAHQILLDVLGLHSGSVEYYQRYAESVDDIHNRLALWNLSDELIEALIAAGYIRPGMRLLEEFGYTGEVHPDILEKIFIEKPNKLDGSLIDDRPLSEIEPIRHYTPEPNPKNYIEWLIDAARTSLDTVRRQTGFKDNTPPRALLYLMLRHASILGYWDSGLRLYQTANVLTGENLRLARQEPKFIHVAGEAAVSESRWQYLYQPEPQITGQPDLQIADYIAEVLAESDDTRFLNGQLTALTHLKDAPTARLERVFAEHVDCATYRLDAWKLGLIHYQLAAMRFSKSREEVTRGLYLGMYGWLEEVRPEGKVLTEVKLKPELDKIFNKPGQPKLMRDSTNAGYIHAPSLNQAVTAAVLRNGHIANATSDQGDMLAINLSSGRVRRALGVIEGIRNGQSLAALLGYRFERGLHDNQGLAEVDKFIYKLRKAFPLVADAFSSTSTSETVAIEAIEARNVMDGLKLVNHIKNTGERTYPFGKNLPTASTAEAAVINKEAEALLDLHDAVSDLAMAESVHQVTQGNYDRAAANLDAYSKSNFPPQPDVIQTPRSGITLTHRVAVHLDAEADPTLSPIAGLAMTPRATAEPAINGWLTEILPDADQVACKVSYTATDGSPQSNLITQADLGLQPIDLLYLITPEIDQAMTSLDDRVVDHVISNLPKPPRPDSPLTIQYKNRTDLGGRIPFFELAAVIKSVRALILSARPLRASDSSLLDEARTKADANVLLDKTRIELVKNPLNTVATNLRNFQTALKTQLEDLATHRDAIINNIDVLITQFAGYLINIGRYGIEQTGIGFLYDWKRITFGRLLGFVSDVTARWRDRLDQYDSTMAEYAALPLASPDEERITILQRAESLVSTTLTSPLPPTPAEYEFEVNIKHNAFIAKKTQLDGILQINTTLLANLKAAIAGELPFTEFDLTGIELSGVEDDILLFAQGLEVRANHLADDLEKRLAEVDARLNTYDTTTTPDEQVGALIEVGQILFGKDFRMIPGFTLSEIKRDEWENAWNARDDLMVYLTDEQEVDFPIDDWLYGVARVREKMHHWENVTFISNAFGKIGLELNPMQFPFKADDRWLALQIPSDYEFDSDRLLYTAHHAVPFDRSRPLSGLLVDEWTEVIPSQEETTGLTFHYDRPNTEPPQVMLLVTPPDFTGHWQWQDLIDTLNETLDFAKRRAIEPEQIDTKVYARFLPATLMAVTMYPITIATNLAMNNQLQSYFVENLEDE